MRPETPKSLLLMALGAFLACFHTALRGRLIMRGFQARILEGMRNRWEGRKA